MIYGWLLASALTASLGETPLYFEANHGQADPTVLFLSRSGGQTMFFTGAEWLSVVRRHDGTTRAIRARLVGADRGAALRGLDQRTSQSHYLISRQPADWITDVPHFARLEQAGVYTGIDLVLHGRQGRLEYDFVVRPDADPRAIRLAFEGVDGVSVDAGGQLVLTSEGPAVVHGAPVVYQDLPAGRVFVEGRYVVADGTVGFEVAPYDRSQPLVIDPTVLVYSTYLGSFNDDLATAVATRNGHAFVTGRTASANFPIHGPAFQTSIAGAYDAFVTKVNADGSDLVFSTFIGGTGNEVGLGIDVDANGHVFIAGETDSTNFPTLNAGGSAPYQSSPKGALEAFVAKLDASGSFLHYSTYLGGTASDTARAVAVDVIGNASVTGETTSTDFPVKFAYQTGLKGTVNAFVTRVNPTGTGLVFSTYLGGSLTDRGHGIAVDTAGAVYVAGDVSSSDFPVAAPAPGPFQAFKSGANDAFVAKLRTSATGPITLHYSSFYGGVGADLAKGVAVDANGNAYIAGQTGSVTLPAGTFPPKQGALAGSTDAFLAKVNPNGTILLGSTFLGGSQDDFGNGVALDPQARPYVVGTTHSANFPMYASIQPKQGGSDVFVTKFTTNGSSHVFSTLFGGGHGDTGRDIAVDSAGDAYVVGGTISQNFPTHSPSVFGPYMAFAPGVFPDSSGFVFKIHYAYGGLFP